MSREHRRAPRPPIPWFLCALGVVVLMVMGGAVQCLGEEREGGFRLAEGIYEPSGVAQIDDGWIVAVEDESSRPFSLLSLAGGAETVQAQSLRARPLPARSLLLAASRVFADLEGVTVGEAGLVYAVTSHSRKSNGKRAAQREQLVRFKVEDAWLTELEVVSGLRKALTEAFPDFDKAAKEHRVKREGGLNIEGLAFDRRRKTLWLGFRGPLLDDDAILVAVANPRGVFERGEPFRFGRRLVSLDLDGGGIRGLTYVPRLKGFLILSQREGGKKEKPFKLWLWGGSRKEPARRVRIDGVPDLRNAEAVAPIRLDGEERILVLSDDGNYRRRRPAKYLLVDYSALRIDSTPPESEETK